MANQVCAVLAIALAMFGTGALAKPGYAAGYGAVDYYVTDLYDDIDLNDANQKDLLSSEDIHPSKRARLDINYSIGPAGTFQSLNGSQQPQQNRRKMTLVNRIV